jgi:CubicO group peptidase (beta-lactamase class C family)
VPVETYLTRWHLPTSNYDADGVTIRRLLNHSAGLSQPGYLGLSPTQPLPPLEFSLSGVRIVREPGSQFLYSGGGYTVLQLVIEEVTGESFAAYMQREVLDPLGMTRSSFEWRDDLRPATAIGHNARGLPYPNFLFTEKAAAGLYTTASDLARFVAAAMTGPQGQPAGRAVLSPGTVAAMLTPVAIADEVVAADVTRPPHQMSRGLGYAMEPAPDGSNAVLHGGGNQGWRALFVTHPERREGIVILTNSDQGSALTEPIMDAWANWLGIRPATAARPAQPNHSTRNTALIAVAGLLVLTAILGGGYLLRRHRARQRA